ncbi:putative GRAM domain, PH domain-containing protein [Medicago truncatula]|uniref:GRAM domain protein/ABA-responsive-like protein n=1 Tax=Medicago truncatula TaxID=3880 RepID=B7FJD2_MEDTR|nr:putative GEM-like protein 8 [Medicago truncatula]ACJ84861.1 unknown [Medicago truncatula]KEH44421.1 GRAM domain protein/ABA-responsive-like protein [Medicago truncatula]RHN82652.1 putative GRAM domain, PH domain-containing protein [Medicago truncatula]
MNTSFLHELLNGISISSSYPAGKSSRRYLPDSTGKYCKSITKSNKGKLNSVLTKMNMFGRKDDGFAHGIREHVRLGPKITDTVKGKLRLGARILQVGGVEKVFMELFSVKDGEKLLKASQCYLSTTSGPIAGLLFISTHKVAFCSEKSIKISSPKGELSRVRYKVSIPHEKIQHVNQSQNVKKPSEKYIEIVTVDGFDFWFMGFFNYRKALRYLQQAILQKST